VIHDVRKRLAAVVVLALAPSVAAGPLVDLLQQRQKRIDQILATDTDDLTQKQKDELADVLAALIDFPAMGRDALGQHWEGRSEAERGEFVALFERLVRANSVRQVDVYRSNGIEYRDERVDGDGGDVVTDVETKSAMTEVEYRFRRIGGTWRVVDYTIDGVSAVRNYRKQFDKILAKHGWAGLLERMTKRVEKLESGGGDDEGGEPATGKG